jgi:hypothetical protein
MTIVQIAQASQIREHQVCQDLAAAAAAAGVPVKLERLVSNHAQTQISCPNSNSHCP